jgi:hypothetical protein
VTNHSPATPKPSLLCHFQAALDHFFYSVSRTSKCLFIFSPPSKDSLGQSTVTCCFSSHFVRMSSLLLKIRSKDIFGDCYQRFVSLTLFPVDSGDTFAQISLSLSLSLLLTSFHLPLLSKVVEIPLKVKSFFLDRSLI